jgi:DNA-binding MarR family transcriptional regulator
MLEKLKRIALSAIGAVGILVQVVARRSRSRLSPHAKSVLRQLATHTSASVAELALRRKLSEHETLQLLTELEERGFVQLSPDHGIGHVRIAAVTKAGREQINRAFESS